LVINSSKDNRVSAANLVGFVPKLQQTNLKQTSLQDVPSDPTSEFPQTEEQFPPQTEEQFPPENEMTIPNEEIPQPSTDQYKVTVRFNDITIHNDHEGKFSGDGEYDLKVYVHGILVDLTKLSTWRDAGLTDVSSGENIKFNPANSMTVNIDNSLPLTIVTAGVEDDGCKGPTFPANIQPVIYSAVADAKNLRAADGTSAADSEKKSSGSSTLGKTLGSAGAAAGSYAGTAAGTAIGGPIGGYIGGVIGSAVGDKVGGYLSKGMSYLACQANPDDKIGVIEESYVHPSYGTGAHSVQSDAKDFTLNYAIIAQKIP
jgi:hypothetical protein